MRNLVVSIDYNLWDDFRIVRLVHKAGNDPCRINIVTGNKYVNVKSISTMMEYFSRFHPSKDVDICVEGNDEEETTKWLMEYLEN